jgi:methylthioribulose-1-phosphate dehydratase
MGTTMTAKLPPLDHQVLVDLGKYFHGRGWMDGTAGNLSIKVAQNPLEFVITPSGVPKGKMQATDLIPLQEQPDKTLKSLAKKVQKTLMPSAETSIHHAVHQTLPGCRAIFHVHPIYSTIVSGLFGQARQRQMLQVEWIEMMKGIGVMEGEIGEIPIFPNWQDIPKLAEEVKQFLLSTPKAPPAILIYNHGLTAWGRTPEEAMNHIEVVEYVCQFIYKRRLLKNQTSA